MALSSSTHPKAGPSSQSKWGSWLYGALFCGVLPLALGAWAMRLDVVLHAWLWPVPLAPQAGAILLLLALGGMALAMWQLVREGQGLPMNAYPTQRWVRRGLYAYLPHPIYIGFIVAVAGASVLCQSSAGAWVLTPTVGLGVLALVWGYEAAATEARLGPAPSSPWLSLPPDASEWADARHRVAALLVALGPWALCYSLGSLLPTSPLALELRTAWELTRHAQSPSQPEWAWWVYSMAYPWVLWGFLAPATLHTLRQRVRAAWVMTGAGLGVMLIWPAQAALWSPDVSAYTAAGRGLVAMNRSLDAAWLACPSFHVAWVVFAGACLLSSQGSQGQAQGVEPAERTNRRIKRIFAVGAVLLWVVLVAWSCVLTGSHAVVDVGAGVLLAALGWRHRTVWLALVDGAAHIANRWNAVQWGPVRFIQHGLWSALAAGAATAYALALLGPQASGAARGSLFFILSLGFIGGAAWGYAWEGCGRLSRPFGYFGFLFGGLLGLLLHGGFASDPTGPLVAALALAAPVAQGVGRLRCLEQGCCHGRPVWRAYGFRVTHPCSRVVALAGLGGVSIHPTPLYSMLANACIALLLWRWWQGQMPWTWLAGAYLLWVALTRFVEERCRGEPQTPVRWGLTLYQWLSLLLAIWGMGLSACAGTPVSGTLHSLSASDWAFSLAIALIAAFSMSVDFPQSNRPLSRLTVQAIPPESLPPKG